MTPNEARRELIKTKEQVSSLVKKVGINPKGDGSQGRSRPRSQSRDNTEVQQRTDWEDVEDNSEKARPSAAMFSPFGHLHLLDEPEEQSEMQTPPSRENPAPQTKTQQLEADLVFQRAQVQKLQEKVAGKEANKTAEYQKMESALKKARRSAGN